MIVELTDEQFDRYCEALRRWKATDEWKNWNDENGHDYFIKRIYLIFGSYFRSS